MFPVSLHLRPKRPVKKVKKRGALSLLSLSLSFLFRPVSSRQRRPGSRVGGGG